MNYDYTNLKIKIIDRNASESSLTIENTVNDALNNLQSVENCIVEKIYPVYQEQSGLLRFVILYREIKGK